MLAWVINIWARECAAEFFPGVKCLPCTGSLARSAYVGREIVWFLMMLMMVDGFLQVKLAIFLLVDTSPCTRMEVIRCSELLKSVVFNIKVAQ